MDGFPSGQRGQTVNLLQVASVVRIHLHPFNMPMWLNWQSSWFVISRLSVRVRSSALSLMRYYNLISRGGAVWKLVGLITRRSQVQILLPQLTLWSYFIDNNQMCVNAQIAQLVEQRTENPRVTGSIPVLGIFLCYNLRIWACSSGGRALDF